MMYGVRYASYKIESKSGSMIVKNRGCLIIAYCLGHILRYTDSFSMILVALES